MSHDRRTGWVADHWVRQFSIWHHMPIRQLEWTENIPASLFLLIEKT